MKNMFFTSLAFIFLLNISCQKTSETSVAQAMSEWENTPPIPFDDYTWKQYCLTSSNTSSFTMTTKFNSNNKSFEQSSDIYTDSNCSTRAVLVTVKGTFELSNKSGVTTKHPIYSAGTGTYTSYNIDWKILEATYTPTTAAQVTNLNNLSFCGYTDWSLNNSKSVAGKICNGILQPAIGAIDYDIVQMYQTPPASGMIIIPANTLFFGKTETEYDGKSPAKRRKNIDTRIGYQMTAL